MKIKLDFVKNLLLLLIAGLFIISCSNDDNLVDNSVVTLPTPVSLGSTVTVTNTLQSDAITGGIETSIENLFNVEAGSLAATNVVSDSLEFPSYLLNLYDINISTDAITFELVAQEGDENYGDFFRVLEEGTTDRYYFTFDTDQNVSGFTSDNESVNLRIDASNILVVEIGEGFNFMPGETFTITLKSDNTTAITPQLTIPTSLSITDETFYPEDITIANGIVYVSGFGNGAVRSINLNEANPTSELFAAAEEGFSQGWGLKSDGTVLLSLLNNADFTGNPDGSSKLVEYNIESKEKTREWNLPMGTVGHTVSFVDGKYYVSDFRSPRIIEIDPTTGTINDNWFTSDQLDSSDSQGLGGTIYNTSENAFYLYNGGSLWYLPLENGQPGTLQEVTITGLSPEQIDMDGISWGRNQSTLYYAANDAMSEDDLGTAYKLDFTDATTATGSVVIEGLDDTSGVWYLTENGKEYLFVLESQFGALFGSDEVDTPFNVEVVEL